MEGKLKDGQFLVGARTHYLYSDGQIVKIINEENHPIFGKRYKVEGHDEWFEENCFEWVK
jgi:hypothetical protein